MPAKHFRQTRTFAVNFGEFEKVWKVWERFEEFSKLTFKNFQELWRFLKNFEKALWPFAFSLELWEFQSSAPNFSTRRTARRITGRQLDPLGFSTGERSGLHSWRQAARLSFHRNSLELVGGSKREIRSWKFEVEDSKLKSFASIVALLLMHLLGSLHMETIEDIRVDFRVWYSEPCGHLKRPNGASNSNSMVREASERSPESPGSPRIGKRRRKLPQVKSIKFFDFGPTCRWSWSVWLYIAVHRSLDLSGTRCVCLWIEAYVCKRRAEFLLQHDQV